jgi:hypothetical protein
MGQHMECYNDVTRRNSETAPEHYPLYVAFEVLTAQTMKSTLFWVVMPRSSKKGQPFGGTYGLHLQGQRVHVSQIRNQHKHAAS